MIIKLSTLDVNCTLSPIISSEYCINNLEGYGTLFDNIANVGHMPKKYVDLNQLAFLERSIKGM